MPQLPQKKPKAKVYIDGANVFYTQRKLGWSIDWEKVKNLLLQEFDVLEFRYYTGLKKGDQGMPRFLRFLDKIDFVTITKPLKKISIGKDHPSWRLYGYTFCLQGEFRR